MSGLVLTMNLQFHNNKTGANTSVTETWTEIQPVDAFNTTSMKITPGNSVGQVETHIFNQCPPGGSPSTYLQWMDNNAN